MATWCWGNRQRKVAPSHNLVITHKSISMWTFLGHCALERSHIWCPLLTRLGVILCERDPSFVPNSERGPHRLEWDKFVFLLYMGSDSFPIPINKSSNLWWTLWSTVHPTLHPTSLPHSSIPILLSISSNKSAWLCPVAPIHRKLKEAAQGQARHVGPLNAWEFGKWFIPTPTRENYEFVKLLNIEE